MQEIIFVSVQFLIQNKKEERMAKDFIKKYPGMMNDVTTLPLIVQEKLK